MNNSNEYISRINKVLDYIETHLSRPLTLQELARVACFSPYHFHRIFGAVMGESLNRFIQRLRLEKAAVLLVNNPVLSITDVAFEIGFTNSAAFSRAFKDHFGMSASSWRKKYDSHSKISKINRKDYQHFSNLTKADNTSSMYIDPVNNKITWRVKMEKNTILKELEVDVRTMDPLEVAYVRYVGPYQGNESLFNDLWSRLCRWAGPRNLIRQDTKFLSVYHDNPDITDEDKLRVSVCLSVPANTKTEGEIGRMVIPGGRYAFSRFRINADQFGECWNAVYAHWLPQSGYQPEDGPCFELYLNDPKNDPEGKFEFYICIPVKPL